MGLLARMAFSEISRIPARYARKRDTASWIFRRERARPIGGRGGRPRVLVGGDPLRSRPGARPSRDPRAGRPLSCRNRPPVHSVLDNVVSAPDCAISSSRPPGHLPPANCVHLGVSRCDHVLRYATWTSSPTCTSSRPATRPLTYTAAAPHAIMTSAINKVGSDAAS